MLEKCRRQPTTGNRVQWRMVGVRTRVVYQNESIFGVELAA